MLAQTDNLLYRLVYDIPGCEQICDLQLRYPKQVKIQLQEKEAIYIKEYGQKAYQKVWMYLES